MSEKHSTALLYDQAAALKNLLTLLFNHPDDHRSLNKPSLAPLVQQLRAMADIAEALDRMPEEEWDTPLFSGQFAAIDAAIHHHDWSDASEMIAHLKASLPQETVQELMGRLKEAIEKEVQENAQVNLYDMTLRVSPYQINGYTWPVSFELFKDWERVRGSLMQGVLLEEAKMPYIIIITQIPTRSLPGFTSTMAVYADGIQRLLKD